MQRDKVNDYDTIAAFYDIEHAHFLEDLDLYRDFAELCGPYGPLLEVACGSGRLLVPLAREGYELTGVDISANMLERARQRLAQEGLLSRVTLVQQDMRALHLEQRFRLAFIALGSFAHLTARKDQQQTLALLRAHLVTGATLILDLSNADARAMENLSGQLLHQGTWSCADGSFLTHFVSPSASTTRHVLDLIHFYDQYCQGEIVRRTVTRTSFYLFERSELELMLEQAGFVVKDVYGSYEMAPYELQSPRMIFIAEAR
ncbi:class I SAM-dependent methyltransferase [Thermogemmatispora sp.]|uniref:class I SAM-dependent DNA methyltransferase n=1 Tax=Thermogemmatispora sp. TaxID=1968838 RepID=UPI002ACBE5EF|nr:class I SAM-dependent methyltransferase [Thermogemmatispora sp.]